MAYSHVASDPVKLQSFVEAFQRGEGLEQLKMKFGIKSSTDVRYLLYKAGVGEKPFFPSEEKKKKKNKNTGGNITSSKNKEQLFAVIVSGIKCSVSVPGGMNAEAEVVDNAINFKITL